VRFGPQGACPIDDTTRGKRGGGGERDIEQRNRHAKGFRGEEGGREKRKRERANERAREKEDMCVHDKVTK